MRFCNGCTQLDKRLKTPCKKGFDAVIGKVSTIRPSKCKKKYKKGAEESLTKKYKNIAIDNFQTYIRYRDNWTCVVCGKKIDPDTKESKMLMHAGHYISRTKTALLLDEKNVHAQCRECNGQQNWEGIDPRYTRYLISKYGTQILDYFDNKKNEIVQLSNAQWQELATFWEEKLKEAKKSYDERKIKKTSL